MPVQNEQQRQATFQAAGQQPAAQTPVTPAPQMNTPAAPVTVNVNNGQNNQDAALQQMANTDPERADNVMDGLGYTGSTASRSTSSSTGATPPGASLQTGATGQNVQQLQSYLVQMGYLTPEQVSTGSGTYGPQTTAAVAKLQQDLGLQAANGNFGPQTQAALSQKYNNLHSAVSGTPVPDQAGQARGAIQGALNQQNDDASNPVMGALTNSMGPIMQSLTQVLNNINNPALTATSLQQEYNDLREKAGLPEMNAQLMNMQRIMNGTADDIRDEVTKAGGFATESQIQGLAAARNKTIMKQYNSLSTQYDAAQQNVQQMTQFAQQDIANSMSRQQLSATVTGSLASIQNQMLQMGMTMQNNARSAAQYNVTQMGYQGLAASMQGNPQMLNNYENLLGLAPGSLSDPAALAQMDTYKNQQLQLNNYKAAITAYQAGYGGGMAPGYGTTPTPGSPGSTVPGQSGVIPVDPTSLSRPSWVNKDVPLTMSADDMQTYKSANKAASVDPGTNNIVAPGVGYYLQQSDGSYVLKGALPSPVDTQYNQIKQTISNAGVFQGSPTVTRKWTLSTNSAIASFKDTGTYKIASNVAPYLAAIHAAAANPGDKSISDFELLDSFVKAAKGGTGQVTDSQVNLMIQGASLGDKYSTLQQKLQNGGVLAPAQRDSLVHLADETYKRNLADYQKGYVQAVQNMQNQGIPAQFWGNLPDFTTFQTIE